MCIYLILHIFLRGPPGPPRLRAVVSTGATSAVAPELFEELLSKNLGFLGLLKCPMN